MYHVLPITLSSVLWRLHSDEIIPKTHCFRNYLLLPEIIVNTCMRGFFCFFFFFLKRFFEIHQGSYLLEKKLNNWKGVLPRVPCLSMIKHQR